MYSVKPGPKRRTVRKRKHPRASLSKEDISPEKMPRERSDGEAEVKRDEEKEELLRENMTLAKETRRQARAIKELERQLAEERAFYEEQKWEYVKEMCSKQRWSDKSLQTDFTEDECQGDSLAGELRRVRAMFYRQRVITCRVCDKFVRLREYKDCLLRRLRKAETVYGMRRMDELVERTAKYAYNNAALHIQLLKQERIIEGFRSKQIDQSECCKCCSKCRLTETDSRETVKRAEERKAITYLSSKLKKARSEEAPRRRKGRLRHSKSEKG
ncbi:uncharacterized protein LOC106670852 isoform X2 [Cimex lectularius]|uniref:Uncharacterized protein n=1 Tax=Cimex lectularius TaxID=79782 RepID=A0A8I6S2T9_CIMLE|nr:uncharacterized protein LOC106670852 isoform X2 [Cimex lectularius]